jgi:hypothetical protein
VQTIIKGYLVEDDMGVSKQGMPFSIRKEIEK